MKAALLSEESEIGAIEDEWRAFAELRGCAFVTPEWFRCWSRHRPDSATPLVAAARRADGSLGGVLPLIFDAARRPRAIRFAGAAHGDRFLPAARPEDEVEVAAAAMSALRQAGYGRYMLALNHVDADADWWREMASATRPAAAITEQQRSQMAYLELGAFDDWEAYLASRSRNFRQQVRRFDRALRRQHEVQVRDSTEATLAADISRVFELHLRRWRLHGDSSLAKPQTRSFLRSFAEDAQRRGWLRLRLLEVDGAPVAGFFGWRVGGSYAFYQSGFDPDWAKRKVGFVLLAATVRSALEEGAEEFDMLLGEEEYKTRFTNATRTIETVIVTRPRSPTHALVAGGALARRYGRRLAARPALGSVARAVRRVWPARDS